MALIHLKVPTRSQPDPKVAQLEPDLGTTRPQKCAKSMRGVAFFSFLLSDAEAHSTPVSEAPQEAPEAPQEVPREPPKTPESPKKPQMDPQAGPEGDQG